MDTFPQRLRYWRHQRGLSQESLSRRADIGVNSVSKLERGVNRPKLSTVIALAGALGITVDQLIEPNGEAA